MEQNATTRSQRNQNKNFITVQVGGTYRGADKSLARPGRKQANVFVRMAWISFGALTFRWGGGLDDSSRLDVVETTRVPDMLVSFLVGLRTYQHPGTVSSD